MIYTAVLYRENGDDYCMGCHMGSSPSELKIYNSSSKEELISLVSNLVVDSMIYAKNNREYDIFDTVLSINGYSTNDSYSINDDIDIPDDILEELQSLQMDLHNNIKELKIKKEQEYIDKKEKERIENENNQRLDKEKKEKEEYERLKQKFEG